jgi:serine/threonine protein kinase
MKPPPLAQLPPAEQRALNQVLEQFEQAWQDGTSPRIEDFCPSAARAQRQPLLEELVRIDLEYQWRDAQRRSTAGPLIEEYVRRFPDLGPLQCLAPELIGEEYEVRHHWGDAPGHAEFLARFPAQQPALGEVLRQTDARLASERKTGPPVAVPAELPTNNTTEHVAAVPSAARLLEDLKQSGLLGPKELADLSHQGATEPSSLARELMQRGWLTPYQVNQLLQGEGANLVLGPYQLLQHLGEGGAGQVFKARHVKMDRLVALKIIRKELLADAEAVSRFRREVQVLSRLDHPNVVHGYDAGPAGATYFLAMEYVEGTDLARLVKECGPLPVMQACAYIRQAALGMQHAHERGLVHRDIKPHNLIMSLREGRIKVADLGLARLPRAANEEATAAQTTGGLTPVGAVMMGTLDYMAPEQALDFHKADIRADIYSLGCTLWYLLVGQAPFAGGTQAQRLLSHQSKEPPVIEKLRTDVPAGLAGVLRRMLAKRPEDRYQTPAEVAQAVTPYISTPDARDLDFDPGGWSVRAGAYTTWAMLCKFAQRNKAFTAVVLTAMVLLAWSSVVNYQARRALERANEQYREERERTRANVPNVVKAARRDVERRQFDDSVLATLDLALEYEPNASEARLLKGQVLIIRSDFARAKTELERYLTQQPGDGNAIALVELCSSKDPKETGNLLKFARVFEQQKMPALADGLLTKHGRHSFEARALLLKIYQKRIEEAWPGLGSQLSLDTAGIYEWNLHNCPQVTSLDPIEGMPLTTLRLDQCTGVQDLAPLRGMPLTGLSLSGCGRVQDLAPLRGMPLTGLCLSGCGRVQDLAPLRGMPLTTLDLTRTGARDLSPLKDMPLTALVLFYANEVRDLSPLKSCRKLTHIFLPLAVDKGMGVLRQMTALTKIQLDIGVIMPSDEFWKQWDAGKFPQYKKDP